jgi:hypothetical protein
MQEMTDQNLMQALMARNLSYKEALKRVLLDTRAELLSKKIKEEVRGQVQSEC